MAAMRAEPPVANPRIPPDAAPEDPLVDSDKTLLMKDLSLAGRGREARACPSPRMRLHAFRGVPKMGTLPALTPKVAKTGPARREMKTMQKQRNFARFYWPR